MTNAAPPAQPAALGLSSSSDPSGSPAGAAPDRMLGKPLTVKQRTVYDLKEAGRTRPEIAASLGISEPVVSKTLQACYRKLGIKKKQGGQGIGTEHRRPEVAAAAIEAAADPCSETLKAAVERVNAQLKASGLPERVSEALVRRLRVKYANAVTATRELRTNEILEMLGNKIALAASYLDDKVLAEASARDIMLGVGVMIEKRNLLRGEPTAIISDHERKKLHELLPALIAEQNRRAAVTVDGKTGEVVEPR